MTSNRIKIEIYVNTIGFRFKSDIILNAYPVLSWSADHNLSPNNFGSYSDKIKDQDNQLLNNLTMFNTSLNFLRIDPIPFHIKN